MALFTAETAKIAAARSWQKSPEFVSARYKPKPERKRAEEPKQTCETPSEDSDGGFKDETLMRVRSQMRLLLDKADTILEKRDMNMKEMRDLAVAIKDMEGVEARLSNRPSPGNLRPVATKPAKQSRMTYPEPVPQFSVMHEAPELPAPAPEVVSGDWSSVLF